MTLYLIAAVWFVLSVVFGVLAGRLLAGKVSPSGSPHVPSCCPPEGENKS